MYRKHKITAIIAIAVALAFVMPVAAVANVGTFGVTSNSENTSDIENIVEISTNSDNTETTDDSYDLDYIEDTIVTEEMNKNIPSLVNSAFNVDLDNDIETRSRDREIYPEEIYPDNVETGDEIENYQWYDGIARKQYNGDLIIHDDEKPETPEYFFGFLDNKQNKESLNHVNTLQGSETTTYYVGGTGSNNYTSIQDAINDAQAGDTVFVYEYSSPYYEGLTIDKAINLIGENRNVTVDGSGYDFVIMIVVNKVNITNFAVRNGMYGIVPMFSSNNNIENCTLYNNSECGIVFFCSSNNKLRDNSINDSFATLGASSINDYYQDIDTSNTVNGKPIYYIKEESYQTFDETMDIGYLWFVSCNNITIKNLDIHGLLMANTTDSTISNVSIYDSYTGLNLWDSSNNDIMNCIAYDNAVGILIESSSYNKIINCDSYHNLQAGVIFQYSSTNNIIKNCNVYDNAYGPYGGYAISFSGSPNNDIINCNSYNHSDAYVNGIRFWNSPNSNIINCTAYNNGDQGIRLSVSPNVNIINCTSYNNEYGIRIYDSPNTNIINCNCYDNNYGISDVSSYLNIINCTVYNNNYGIYPENYDNIINCTAYNNNYGIYLWASNNNVIKNCDSYNNKEYGIWFFGASKNIITNCNFYNNPYGVYIWCSQNNNLKGNSIYNNVYDFSVTASKWSPNIKDFYHDIDPSNMINGKHIYYLVEQEYMILDGTIYDFGYLALISCNHITAKNADVTGMLVVDTTDSTISNVNSHNSGNGIYFCLSSNNNIINCTACDNEYGISLYCSPNNHMKGNNIYNNAYNFNVGTSWYTPNIKDFYHDIDTSNTINEKPIYYLIEESGIEVNETDNFGYLGLILCDNITAKNSEVYGILLANTTDSTISNVNSHNSGNGIFFSRSPNNNIINCNAYNNDMGMYLHSSPNCNIINCTFYNNFNDGIYSPLSPNCNIINCTSYNNTYGFHIHKSSNSDLTNCNLYNNRQYGIHVYSSSNNLTNCDCYNNSWNGIWIYNWDCDSSTNITNCNCYNNLGYGILIAYFSNNEVTNCDCYNNQYGFGIISSSINNKIINCNSYNNNYGIYLDFFPSNNLIINCNLYNNNYGIYPYPSYAYNNLIYHNNFVDNVQNAYDKYANQWDNGTEGNYWSDYTGVDADGNGIGDTPYLIPGGSQDNYPLMMILDDIPPEITDIQATPKVQKTTEPVNITFMVTDNWDLIDTVKLHIDGPEGFTLEITMNEGSYWYEDTYTTMGIYYYFIWANDTNGNIAISDTYSFVITEFNKPTSAVNPLPTWTKTISFTVTATAFDNTGVANVTLYYRYSDNGTDWTDWTSYGIDEEDPWSWSFTGVDGYYEFYSIAVDDVGNVEDPPDIADATTGLDTTKPVTTIILDGTIGENGWYTSNVEVTLSATDELSEVESTWYSLDSGRWKLYTTPFTVSSEGQHTVEYYSFDRAGNREDTKSVDIKIDKTPPVTVADLSGTIGENNWYVSDVLVTFTATDATSGVDVTKYSVDGGSWQTGNSVTVTTDGEHTVEYYSIDNAGNVETTKTVDFKIDQTVPTIDLTWDGENSKLVADVYDETSLVAKVEFYVNDELLGEDTTSPYEWEVTNPKKGDKGQAIVFDNAGNEAISEEIDAVSQSSQRSSSSSSVLWPFSWLFGLW